jgi:hypothetical protein
MNEAHNDGVTFIIVIELSLKRESTLIQMQHMKGLNLFNTLHWKNYN